MLVDTDLEVDGGLDVAGTVRLGFTGNDPVILGDPNGKRTEWNNPGYLEIYAENPDSPGDFNETVDIDGEFLGGGYVGVYPVRTENRHGVRMHSRNATGIEANYIDIASVESSAVYDEDQIRLITAVDGIGTYAGIKISHPTDNRFRFNSEFNTEPTVPFLVNDNAKFTSQVIVSGNINGQAGIEGESLTINTGPSTITGELDKDGSKITNLADPTVAQDAATKAYVDTTAGAIDLDFTGNSGTGNVQQGSTFDILGSGPITTSAAGNVLTINSSAAEGTGTTNTLPVWSDGPNGVLGDSGISETRDGGGNISNIIIATDQATNPLNVNFGSGGTTSFKNGTTEFIKLTNQVDGFYTSTFRYGSRLTVDRNASSQNPSLDVGDSDHTYPAAWFRNGVVISNNPSGVQVDNTSMVIGAGNNDNVSGSDHCLIVGSGNQITNNSDQSVAFGQGNTITSSIDSCTIGNQNALTSASRTLALGYSNDVSGGSCFIAGGENTVSTGATNLIIGYNNTTSSNKNFVVGEALTSDGDKMVLGYRNYTTGYPTPNKNLGLGETKFVVAVGSSTTTPSDNNAIIITEGGINGGSSGAVPQVPRVILPTIVNFNFVDDAAAAAGGIPIGGLYHNAGVIRIRLT